MLISAKGAEHASKQEQHVAYGRGAGAQVPAIRTAARKGTNPKGKETPVPRGPKIPALAEYRGQEGRRCFQLEGSRHRRVRDDELPAEKQSPVRSMVISFVLITEVEPIHSCATRQEVRGQQSPVSSMHACTAVALQARVRCPVRRDRAKSRTPAPTKPRIGDALVWFPARLATSADSIWCDRGGILAPASVALRLKRPPSTRFLALFAALESMETVTPSLLRAQSITAIAISSTAKSLHSPPTWNKTWVPCASF